MGSRLRSPAQRAPQNREQALELCDRFAQIDAQIAIARAERDEQVQLITAAADAVLVPLVAEQADLAKRLKPWFEGNFEALTGGKRKSIEIGGVMLGFRISPAKVAFAGGKDEDAAKALLGAELADLVRTTHAPDKPAILRRLEGDDAAQLLELGFSRKQGESFFVERNTPNSDAATLGDA